MADPLTCRLSNLEDMVGLPKPRLLEDGNGHVEDRDAARRPPSEAPAVRVSMESNGSASFVQGSREETRAEKGVYLRRLALYCSADRRVVEDPDAPLRPQPPELVLQGPGIL